MTTYSTDQLLAMLDQPTARGTTGSRVESERRAAAMALGAHPDPAVVPALLQRLRAETPGCGVHETLTWATVQHIDTALPDVLAMLTDADPHLRRTGAHILSKVGGPDHYEALAPLVSDEHPDVAIKAYRAVAHTGLPQAAAVLAQRLGDGDDLQRDALTAAFAKIGEPSVPVLINALDSDSPEVRLHAADTLGYLGQVATPAIAALTTLASDDDADVRLAAVSALGELGEAATEALTSLADSDDARVAMVARRLID